MQKRLHAVSGVILSAFLALCLVPAVAFAESSSANPGEGFWESTNEFGQTIIISAHPDDDSAGLADEDHGPAVGARAFTTDGYLSAYSIEEAGAIVRENMVNRASAISICYYDDSNSITSEDACRSIAYSIMDEAFRHTGNPIEGDYICRQFQTWRSSLAYAPGYVKMGIEMTYYTDANEEAQMDTAVKNVLDGLDLGGRSAYEKTKAIYQYVCSHVAYDFANPDDYVLKYSAYAALVNGTSVCNGYACLMYRLLLESGVDARVIVGTGNGGPHAWNIVSFGGYYYNLDATWDSNYGDQSQDYRYFLKSPSFADHVRDAEFQTDSFCADYPMAPVDFSGECAEHVVSVLPGRDATCTQTGLTDGACCKMCGAIIEEQVEIPALGHAMEACEAKSATCTSGGHSSYQKCSRCGSIDGYKETAALGHSYSKATTQATLSANGAITEKCETCGDVKSRKAIYRPGSFSLSAASYVYDGSKKTPSVTVEDVQGNVLKSGTDYSLTYASDRTVIGRYSVKVTMKGSYSGTKTLYFGIGPKAPKTETLKLYGYDDVKVSWSDVAGESGYAVYYKKASASSYVLLKRTASHSATIPNLADGVKYNVKVVPYKNVNGYRVFGGAKVSSIYTMKKLGAPSVTRYASGKVKVKWGNIPGESGYQISRSASSTGTNIVSTYATTTGSYKIVKAAKGKTYYYKVRAYKVVSGKKVYAPWSASVKYRVS